MILATDVEGNIGYKNKLLYWFKEDLERFKNLTKGSPVIMGRNTWLSLPIKLPHRLNLVLSNSESLRKKEYSLGESKIPDGFIDSIDEILEMSKEKDVWVIGGAMLYKELFQYADVVEHTLVHDIAKESDSNIGDMGSYISKYYYVNNSITIDSKDKISGRNIKVEFLTYTKK